MFLWVTDFYSLEKIISVSAADCVTVFKEENNCTERGRESRRAKGREDGERGHRGIFLGRGAVVTGVAGLDVDCCRSLHPEASAVRGRLECECQESQV